METAPLKSFAMWARTALIREVTGRIAAVLAPGSSERVELVGAVAALEKAIAAAGGGEKGRAGVADKVAYTWFNRIIALRFMDANGYTGIGVVSPQAVMEFGQPEILGEAKLGVIDAKVVSQKIRTAVSGLLDGTRPSGDPQGEAYALLLAEYCRHWNRSMPFMFEREGDYTELLIPANLLADDSVLSRSVKVLTTEVCKDVEVIGWLYQFYISERKDEVFAGFKKNKKAGADEIPAATQLFTPHWIVRYLVENSLGRLWMLNHPSSNLVSCMGYYIPPVDEEADFLKITSPEELKIIDPACGSGHMLTYAFDLLYAIYEEEGYGQADIPGLIIANNLYGTEIDPRAGALAAFALTMKAREKQRTFFNKQVEPNICVLEPISFSQSELDLLAGSDGNPVQDGHFWNQFKDADVFGSLIRPDSFVTSRYSHALNSLDGDGDMIKARVVERAQHVALQAKILGDVYPVVVANPPYMGSGNMDSKLSEFARREYSQSKNDLYAMFIERCFNLIPPLGMVGMITQDSWMFLAAYSKYRQWLLQRIAFKSVSHLGLSAFDSFDSGVVSTVAFTASRDNLRQENTIFIRAVEGEGLQKAEKLIASNFFGNQAYIRSTKDFLGVPNTPIIYWASEKEISTLSTGPYVENFLQAREGLTTGDNNKFLRRWHEISHKHIAFNVESSEAASLSRKRWFPYQKGGSPRRWSGNFEFVVDWGEDGRSVRENIDESTKRVRSHNYNGDFGFRPGLTWSGIAAEGFAVRHVGGGFMFDAKGPMAFSMSDIDIRVIEGFLNSTTATKFMRLLSPRLDFKIGHVLSLPVRIQENDTVCSLVEECIEIARSNWRSHETAPEFRGLSVVEEGGSLKQAIDRLYQQQNDLDKQLNIAEEKLDVIFATEYSDLSPLSEDPRLLKQVAQSEHQLQIVGDLISFSVGCMFGRYSFDEPGLILADQGATLQEFLAKVQTPTFMPDKDNVIPIVDGDWFEDDIVTRFREFLRVAFGSQHFEENLRYITEALGVRSLRDYFVKSYYKDHVQRYKKRPIYWLFSSPKGSFNALIYMHRYSPSTVSTVLNEYLREFQAKIKASLEQADRSNNEREADRLRKVLFELDEYEHDVLYPLASQKISIDLDDGVKANYPRFGDALKKIPGLESSE